MIIISIVLLLVGGLFVYLLIKSPGKVTPISTEGSIGEKTTVSINNSEQGLIIKGADINNPVILFVHGGPGMPEFFIADQYFDHIYKDYTLCFWEQRGAGFTDNNALDYSQITVDQLVEDTAEIARYLSARFKQEKVILLSHSWGSFIGIKAAKKYPELFSSYIGVAQIVNTIESEIMAFDHMRSVLEASNNTSDLKELLSYLDTETNTLDLQRFMSSAFRDVIMHKLSVGTMKNMTSVELGVMIPFINSKAYTLVEKINFWVNRGRLVKETTLRQELYGSDLRNEITSLDIPVYFMSGVYDYTVNYELSAEYLEVLTAPDKEFFLFENSAHSPMFEEPNKFLDILNNLEL